MKKLVRSCFLALALLGVASAASASTIWTFHDVTLTGRIYDSVTQTFSPITETVTGSFRVTTGIDAVDQFSVTVTGNYAPFEHVYDSSNILNQTETGLLPTGFALTFWSGNLYLSIEVQTPLFETAAPANIFLSSVNGLSQRGDGTYTCESNCAQLSSAGYITANGGLTAGPTAAAVPEPATLSLLVIGGSLGAHQIRRRRRA